MFSITIHSEDEALLEYLNYEGTLLKENTFEFSSGERVADVLSRYIFFEIKNNALSKLFPEIDAFASEIEAFLMFVPYDYEEMWKSRVRDIVKEYIETENVDEFYIDGFLTFRMADIKRKYFDYLEDEYNHYIEATEPTESLEALIDFMNSQSIKTNEILIETKENGHIVIKDGDIPIYMELDNEQENLVVQSVYAAPRTVKVVDEFRVLRKELIIVLKQIFGRNLTLIRKSLTEK